MKDQFSLSDRLRYQFDNFMAKGTIALIGGLAVASAAIIAVISLIVWIAHVEEYSFGELLWLSLLRTLDSGTMGGDTGHPVFLFSMLAVTFGGIFIISALIGVLNNGIEGKLEELRKGRSRVIERNHTIILGWSEQVFTIISELVVANANQRRPCIVVMGEKDKVEMEDEIRGKIEKTGRTRIVCRTGSSIDLADLDIVSLNTSKSIIVLAPEGDDPDSSVIKTILAITNNPKRRKEPYHIVAEIRDPKNMEAARLVGKDEAELVLSGDLISRITAQTCRQSGLSIVYTELLNFGGDEIYFKEEPGLVGKTLGESLLMYEASTVIGLKPKGGLPQLKPPLETVIQPGDQIVAISADDDTVVLSGLTDWSINQKAIRLQEPATPRPERTLILGWNGRAPSILNELDNYVAPGSAATVVADFEGGEAEIDRLCPRKNQSVHYQAGDTTDRRTLEALKVETYQHVIVLSYSEMLDPQHADARTLVTLLHLREIAERAGHPFSIVSEMLDIRNRALAEVAKADDFIVSDQLVSLMLSQVSENKLLNPLFADIFDPEGSEIYVKLASNYVTIVEPVNFYTVVEAARRRGEIAIGYKVRAHASDAEQSYGVVTNPPKSKMITFAEWDRIIVVAEE
jgi:voltage-gated potassium channel Kch